MPSDEGDGTSLPGANATAATSNSTNHPPIPQHIYRPPGQDSTYVAIQQMHDYEAKFDDEEALRRRNSIVESGLYMSNAHPRLNNLYTRADQHRQASMAYPDLYAPPVDSGPRPGSRDLIDTTPRHSTAATQSRSPNKDDDHAKFNWEKDLAMMPLEWRTRKDSQRNDQKAQLDASPQSGGYDNAQQVYVPGAHRGHIESTQAAQAQAHATAGSMHQDVGHSHNDYVQAPQNAASPGGLSQQSAGQSSSVRKEKQLKVEQLVGGVGKSGRKAPGRLGGPKPPPYTNGEETMIIALDAQNKTKEEIADALTRRVGGVVRLARGVDHKMRRMRAHGQLPPLPPK